MDTKCLQASFVVVEGRKSLYVRSFPLQDEDVAVSAACGIMDKMSTGCCKVSTGSIVMSLRLIEATRNGRMFTDESQLLALDS